MKYMIMINIAEYTKGQWRVHLKEIVTTNWSLLPLGLMYLLEGSILKNTAIFLALAGTKC